VNGLTLAQPGLVGLAVAAAWLVAAVLTRNPSRPALRRYGPSAGLAGLAVLLGIAPEGLAHLFLLALGLAAGAALAAARANRDVPIVPGGASGPAPPRGHLRPARGAVITLRTLAWLCVLLLVGRPACDRTVIEWDRPLLVVVLDQSESMGFIDGSIPPTAGRSRADRANAAFAAAAQRRARLLELYDVRVLAVGSAATASADDWLITPTAPLTPLADTLRTAATLRSGSGQPPAAVLVVSDGADNVAEPAALPAAAEPLAALGTPLYALGVGPEPGSQPLIDVAPLTVPVRIGLRDKLRVTLNARLSGYPGRTARVDLMWDDTVAATCNVDLPGDRAPLASVLTIDPPGPGVHRLSGRVSVGDDSATASALVEVVVERARVVFVERSPSPDFAFALRALPAEADFEAERRLLGTPGCERLSAACAGADVVVLGRLPGDMTIADYADLFDAVTQRGVGAFLAGGRDLLGGQDPRPTPLETLLPAEPRRQRRLSPAPVQVKPTPAGLRHPLFALPSPAAEPWPELPPLTAAPLFGSPKPAAVVLAVDEHNHPLLLAQDLGRGRVLAAAWEELWPWALASDAGHALHTRFWRQAAAWLANRRPTAWLVTDQPRYTAAALTGGRRRVRIRAGLSAPPEADLPQRALAPRLRLTAPGTESDTDVPMRADGATWIAELPVRGESLPAGTYELRFSVPLSAPGAAPTDDLTAATRFEIVAVSPESQPPTADLAALAAAAETTRAVGGRYRPVEQLPDVLGDLTRVDRRRRLERAVRTEWLTADPWGLLGWLTTLLAAEWVLRRRCGWA